MSQAITAPTHWSTGQLSWHDRLSRFKSKLAYGACIGFTIVILALLALVTGYLVVIGFSSLNWAFFSQLPAAPGTDGYPGGMLNGLVGTPILIGAASLVGIPLGLLAGIYLSEYSSRSRIAGPVRFISDVLAGVPSIVVGILGYELLVVPLQSYNGWAGSMALAFLMVPIIARTTEEMLRLVPNSYREASIALGASKARTILRVVLPAATGSVITGIMLSIARVAGETAPLLFTAMGARFLPLFFAGSVPVGVRMNEPFPSLTEQIFSYATSPYKEQNSMAWAGILVLICLIFVLNLAIRLTTRRAAKMRQG